jgi:hypothetical protein
MTEWSRKDSQLLYAQDTRIYVEDKGKHENDGIVCVWT